MKLIRLFSREEIQMSFFVLFQLFRSLSGVWISPCSSVQLSSGSSEELTISLKGLRWPYSQNYLIMTLTKLFSLWFLLGASWPISSFIRKFCIIRGAYHWILWWVKRCKMLEAIFLLHHRSKCNRLNMWFTSFRIASQTIQLPVDLYFRRNSLFFGIFIAWWTLKCF